jgi:hypothetical protein
MNQLDCCWISVHISHTRRENLMEERKGRRVRNFSIGGAAQRIDLM